MRQPDVNSERFVDRANEFSFAARLSGKGPRAHGKRGRGASRRPRPAEHRHHHEAGFIEADQVSAPAREFFLPGSSLAGSTRARGDRRAPSRAAGGAAD